MPLRAFISADLPPLPTLDRLTHDLRAASSDLKVVSADHLHITLKFLGDTEEGLLPEIVSAMREASAGIAPFTIHVQGTGAFPTTARPRVHWDGLEGGEPLGRNARTQDENQAAHGYPRETRSWSPHVTLARVRGRRGLERALTILRMHADETFAEIRLEEIRLKKSVLQTSGPAYSTLESVRLEG